MRLPLNFKIQLQNQLIRYPIMKAFCIVILFIVTHFSLNGQTKMQLINSNDGHKNIYEILSSYIQIKSESGNEKELVSSKKPL